MKVFVMKIELRASWVHSLKEKRMVVKSLIQKLKNKFNISVCEADNQDVHKSIIIGICGLSTSSTKIDSIIDNIINYVEECTDAEIVTIETEKEEYS